jgi:glutamate transport system substrate-binding protein
VKRRKRCIAGALIGLAVLIAGCSTPEVPATPSPSGSGDGKITIGIAFDEPGIGLKEGDTYSGFDVETAKYIAAGLGVPVQNITFVQAIPAERENLLINGDVDLVVATYSITDERAQKVDFAGPYFLAHQDLLIRRNDTEITGPESLDGRNLCSVTGTTSAAYIKEHFKGRIQLQEYGTYSECVTALVAGDVDAVTTDDVILAGFAAQPQYKGVLKVVGKGFTDEHYGVGIKKGDSEMVSKVSAILKTYIDSGTWRKVLEATVGPSGYAIPDPPTVTTS